MAPIFSVEDRVLAVVKTFISRNTMSASVYRAMTVDLKIDTSLVDDLQLDSLDRYELASDLEGELYAPWVGYFGTTVVFDAEEEIFNWVTLEDVVVSAKKYLEVFRKMPVMFSRQVPYVSERASACV